MNTNALLALLPASLSALLPALPVLADRLLAFLTLLFIVGAIGSVLFFVTFLDRLGADERRFVQRRVAIAVSLAFLCLLAPVPLAVVTEGGSRAILRVPAYVAALKALTLDVLPLQALGLALCLFVYRRTLPAYGLAMTGALLLAFTFTQWGRSHDLGRPDSVALLTLHVACAAFWYASYAPLAFIARRSDTREGAAFIRDWVKIAQRLVVYLLLAGLYLVYRMDNGLAAYKTMHGQLALAKLAFLVLMLCLALVNRRRHLPRMMAGDLPAATALVRQIRREKALALIVLLLSTLMVRVV
jgi:putative copper export protein